MRLIVIPVVDWLTGGGIHTVRNGGAVYTCRDEIKVPFRRANHAHLTFKCCLKSDL